MNIEMLLKILKIFLLFLAFGLCETTVADDSHIDTIRNDYCEDYCANECKVGDARGNDKTCTKTKNTIITDKYKMMLTGSRLSITWITNLVNLTHLRKLDSSPKLADRLKIKSNAIVTENTAVIPSTHYLKTLNLYYVYIYTNINIIGQGNLKTLEFNVYETSGPITTEIHAYNIIENQVFNISTFFINYLSEAKQNLKSIQITTKGTLHLRNDIFQNNTQLEIISFHGPTLQNLNTTIFDKLTHIKNLNFFKCSLDNHGFLRSSALQNNLEKIGLINGEHIDLKYLESYQKLKSISVNNEYNSYYTKNLITTNLTAFVCYGDNVLCLLNNGINGKRCPSKCKCELLTRNNWLMINCSRQEKSSIPDLPIPIRGEVYLFFENNGLLQLPDTSSEGYDNLQKLYLANNNLTSIQMNQLPKKLRFLDIRNNSLTSLDANLAAFLMERRDEISLFQSGISWQCNCNNTNLLSYLALLSMSKTIDFEMYMDKDLSSWSSENPVHFHHLKEPCPNDCTCCVNGSEESQFIINCTRKALTEFPTMTSNILGYSSLLLDDNLIETLPTYSVQNFTLSELHLKNNSLIHLELHQLPSNLRVLDIRQNNLKGLDDDVTRFISNVMEVQLSENPWQCSCKFTKFLFHLRNDYPIEYKAAIKRCSGQEYCPDLCTCCKEDESRRFIINCSSLGLREMPAKLPTTENATLLFNNNKLRSLRRSTKIEGFDQLKELHLRYNRITEMEVLPENFQFLDIRNNSLSTLNESLRDFLMHKSNTSSNLSMLISGNPWICHCKEILFFRLTKTLVKNIKDLCKTECEDQRLFVSLEEKDICPDKIPRYVIFFTSFIMLSCLLSFLQCFWKSIRMWLYEKRLFLRLTTRLEKGIETKYDCFLAYCHKDSHLVREYVERLEQGRNQLRLCFYERDWLAGEPIPDCICTSVENSKCTVIIMTKNFLKSVWGRLEFRLALHATSKDQHKRLIVIVYPGVENFDELDGELQSYMKLNTYLMRSDANFWNKLIYALPHKKVDQSRGMEVIEMEPVNSQSNHD